MYVDSIKVTDLPDGGCTVVMNGEEAHSSRDEVEEMRRDYVKASVKTTIRRTPHPNPDRAIDILAELVLSEIMKREEEARTG